MENPFRPSFGRTPPELLDRTDVLEEFEYGLTLRSGVLGLLTIITGARGVGKTVMLNEAQDLARQQGWAVITNTATAGFLSRIADAMRTIDEELGTGLPPGKSRHSLLPVSASPRYWPPNGRSSSGRWGRVCFVGWMKKNRAADHT